MGVQQVVRLRYNDLHALTDELTRIFPEGGWSIEVGGRYFFCFTCVGSATAGNLSVHTIPYLAPTLQHRITKRHIGGLIRPALAKESVRGSTVARVPAQHGSNPACLHLNSLIPIMYETIRSPLTTS